MYFVQEMCGRIGMVTGKGLSRVLKENYSKKLLWFCVAILLIANTVNVGADLGAMAASGQLVIGLPYWAWLVIITAITLILQVFVPYPTYARFLKYLTFSLFAYIVTVFIVKQNWSVVLASTFMPSISYSKEYLLNIVALLGTTISPYLFFWQADEEVEEELEHHKVGVLVKSAPKINEKDIRHMREDTVSGMFFSNLVMFFIITTTASTLNGNGITQIETASQAAAALKPFAGDFAFLLFTLGIIGTGLLAVPVLSGSASYAICEGMGWKNGLSRKFHQAKYFYIIIIISTLMGLLVNFLPIKPFELLYYTAVLNGVCAPPLLFMLLVISNNKKIMGDHTNTRISNIFGVVITIVMTVASLILLYTMVS